MPKRIADLRALFFVFFSIAIQASGFILLPESWALKLLICIAACQTCFVCAVISHNTMHCPMFKSRFANRLVQFLLTVGQGDAVSSFIPGHNLGHHTHLEGPKDTMRTTKMRFRWNLLNQVLFMFMIGGDLVKHTYRYVWATRTRKKTFFRQFFMETIFLFSIYGALIWNFGLEPFLLYGFIPHLFSSWGIIGVNFVQHDGCDSSHPVNHSRNFVGTLMNWWTFNNGYHGIHHAHPGLHWSLLPEAHAKEFTPTIHPSLEQKSLIAYCFVAYIWPGERRTYDGKPRVLPPPIPDETWVPRLDELADVSLSVEG